MRNTIHIEDNILDLLPGRVCLYMLFHISYFVLDVVAAADAVVGRQDHVPDYRLTGRNTALPPIRRRQRIPISLCGACWRGRQNISRQQSLYVISENSCPGMTVKTSADGAQEPEHE